MNLQYILNHSGASLVLVDHEYAHLVEDSGVPTIISSDSGDLSCAYEQFVRRGREVSERKGGWAAIELQKDENAGMALCYTSGTTGRPKGTEKGLLVKSIGSESNSHAMVRMLDNVSRVVPCCSRQCDGEQVDERFEAPLVAPHVSLRVS
jgi:long-subunit acyl-CoA synthetase (AMP-forming)